MVLILIIIHGINLFIVNYLFMNLSDNNIKAIFLIILGMFVFAIQDSLIKLISDSINIYVIYISRSLIGITAILFYCKINNIKVVFKTYYPITTILRVAGFFRL